MKIRYVFYLIYLLIIVLIPCTFFSFAYKTSTINIESTVTSIVSKKIGVNDVSVINKRETIKTYADPSALNINKDNNLKNIENSLIPSINIAGAKYSDVLETQVGKLTAYGPDCAGCGGKVGWGQDVRNGNIYYNDATYGTIRIVAGDKKYPYGTIVRIKNHRKEEIITAIILDRGGAVGIGKATMFDLLFTSNAEASNYGTSNNCTFEILRYGF